VESEAGNFHPGGPSVGMVSKTSQAVESAKVPGFLSGCLDGADDVSSMGSEEAVSCLKAFCFAF